MLKIPQIGKFPAGKIPLWSCPQVAVCSLCHEVGRKDEMQQISHLLGPTKPSYRASRGSLDTALSDLLQLKERSHTQISTLWGGI